jgi:Amidase
MSESAYRRDRPSDRPKGASSSSLALSNALAAHQGRVPAVCAKLRSGADQDYADDMTDITVDDATLDAAERLLGVRYTDAERAQMRDNLAGQLEQAVQRRAVRLPNALPPATLFDPRLAGFAMPAQSAPNIPRNAPTLPQADEDIAFAAVRHLSAWIAGGQLTSVRLTRIYLDRIRRHHPMLFSFAIVTESIALAQAEQADRQLAAGTWLSPLHGIPYGAKGTISSSSATMACAPGTLGSQLSARCSDTPRFVTLSMQP